MPRPKRFTLEEITRAAGKAGIVAEIQHQEFTRKLSENLPGNGTGRPPGRPPENDDERLLAVARRVSKGEKTHAAAKQVTAHLPESERAATLQRLCRKFGKDRALSADRLDYGQFLRRIQRDPEF